MVGSPSLQSLVQSQSLVNAAAAAVSTSLPALQQATKWRPTGPHSALTVPVSTLISALPKGRDPKPWQEKEEKS